MPGPRVVAGGHIRPKWASLGWKQKRKCHFWKDVMLAFWWRAGSAKFLPTFYFKANAPKAYVRELIYWTIYHNNYIMISHIRKNKKVSVIGISFWLGLTSSTFYHLQSNDWCLPPRNHAKVNEFDTLWFGGARTCRSRVTSLLVRPVCPLLQDATRLQKRIEWVWRCSF